MTRIIPLTTGFLAFFCTFIFAAEPEPSLLSAGQIAPGFMLKNIKGQWVSLRDFCGNLRNPWKNKVKYNVVISFWATYCKPCKKEIPELEKLTKEYAKSTRLLLVSIDKEGRKIVAPYVKERRYKATVLLDSYQRTAKKYGAKAVPAMFLVDKRGVIRYVSYGYDEEKGLEKLKEILKGMEETPKKAQVEGKYSPQSCKEKKDQREP